MSDLEVSLENILKSKKAAPPPPANGPANSQADSTQLLPQAFAHATPPPVAPPTLAVSTEHAEPEAQQEQQEEVKETTAEPAVHFGGLSKEFLQSMQSALEQLNYDMASADLVAQLAGGLICFVKTGVLQPSNVCKGSPELFRGGAYIPILLCVNR